MRCAVLANTYRDSVSLMRLAADVAGRPGVLQAVAVMGTESNRLNLQQAGLLTRETPTGGPADLILAVAAVDGEVASAALEALRTGILASDGKGGPIPGEPTPLTLESAVRCLPGANLALISVPGDYAADEAARALYLGLDVFLFSDNVPLEAEVELKRLARERGRLVMGPDCGTALLYGVPLGFANRVRRGKIGIVGAAGTGIQELSTIIDRAGQGISHAIGTGGRDLDDRVGGSSTLQGLEFLHRVPDTSVLVVVSKAPGRQTVARLVDALPGFGRLAVLVLLGARELPSLPAGVWTEPTLEQGAFRAVALVEGIEDPCEVARRIGVGTEEEMELPRRMRATGRWLRGLFVGGTLCQEALVILESRLGTIRCEVPPAGHTLIDLGDDVFTRGRPHPMIDPTLRQQWIRMQASDPEVAVILLDVVLGHGAHPDPAGAVAEAVSACPPDDRPVFVASVCGTEDDPQIRSKQEERLRQAGVLVCPTTAAAARLAARFMEGVTGRG